MIEAIETIRLRKHWQEVAERMSRVVDNLGRPIDPGIFETVVVLNALGLATMASCEGHLDHGVAAPWIDIEPQGANSLREKITILQREAYPERVPGKTSYPLSEAAKLVSDQLKRKQLELCKKIMEHLDHFYEGRHIPYDCHLILHSWGRAGRMRLESIGADLQDFESQEVREQKLVAYQEEMRAFTTFLKNSYFAQEKPRIIQV